VTSGPGGAGRPSSSGRPLPAPNPVLAVALTLVACAFFAGTNVGAKLIATAPGPALHPLQIVFGRFLFGTLLLAPLLLIEGPSLLRSRVPYAYLLRSGCSVGAAACIYASVAVLPLADVTALTYSSPLFMLILAALLLRERVDGWRWLAVVAGFAGVVVMTAPSLDAIQPMALVALLAAVLMSGELIALRFIAQRDPPLSALFLTNLVGLGLSTLCAPFVWQPATASQWELMLLIGAVTVSGQMFFVRAVAMGEASLLAPSTTRRWCTPPASAGCCSPRSRPPAACSGRHSSWGPGSRFTGVREHGSSRQAAYSARQARARVTREREAQRRTSEQRQFPSPRPGARIGRIPERRGRAFPR
jgi:drug/metabolite transporter (DMT)-like permease